MSGLTYLPLMTKWAREYPTEIFGSGEGEFYMTFYPTLHSIAVF